MLTGEYTPGAWKAIDKLNGEIELLAGAIAALRWAAGDDDVIDLGLPGYLNLEVPLPYGNVESESANPEVPAAD